MNTVHDVLKCGECGGETFSLLHVKHEDDVRFGGGSTVAGHLVVRCAKCLDETEIRAAQPALVADGNLCGGWS